MDIISLLKNDEEARDTNLAIIKKKHRKTIGTLGVSDGYTYESLAYSMLGKNNGAVSHYHYG